MKSGMKIRVGIVLAVVAAVGAGFLLASKPYARGGDKVWVELDCRADGEMVMTTDAAKAEDPSVAKSEIFLPLKKYEPIDVEARSGDRRAAEAGFAQALEAEIEAHLAAAVMGMKPGEKRSIVMEGAVPPALPHSERFLDLARVRVRPKITRIPFGEFREHLGDPEVGMQVPAGLELPAEVVEVTNDEVAVRYEIAEGTEIQTPVGPAKVQDLGENFGFQIQRKPGDVLRLGPLVGVVVRVDEELITIDFGHPFGGKQLACEIEVKRIESGPRSN